MTDAVEARAGSGGNRHEVVLANVSDALAGSTVLVVDDGEVNVKLLERLLTRAGAARVIGLTDSRQAIEVFRTEAPDMVILDLHMPDPDGIAVLESLRAEIADDAFVPILMLTADGTLDARQQALLRGANDFVNKPFEQSELLLRVKNLLTTRLLHNALQRHNAALVEEMKSHKEREAREAAERAAKVERIRQAMDDSSLTMVFQPIVSLATGEQIGAEALARFASEPYRTPDKWFAEAHSVALGVDLELLAIERAVVQVRELPPGTYSSVNASPATVLDPRLDGLLAPVAESIVLELTEHAAVASYEPLVGRLNDLRSLGVRLAVDDAGSGYASLRHILQLAPDVIKLDLDLVRGIDTDPARRALAAALVSFATEIGAAILAEGVETQAECEVLHRLGVTYGQGYLFGRPAPLDGAATVTEATGYAVSG